ncbi:MAG: ATP-binding protein, partial [Gemmatimonadota bacterium]|nr:ATP-binding protein [Gemmatimonadota bacterium]
MNGKETACSQLEKRLIELEYKAGRLESIAFLAKGMAHDFNNILTGILGNIALAKIFSGDNEKLAETLAGAEKASLQARDLTHRLLVYCTREIPVCENASLDRLIEDSARFSLMGGNVKGAFGIQDDLWPVDVDAEQIGWVINNVVINVRQAMPNGGRVEVRAVNVCVGPGDVPPLEPGKYVKISVGDQGEGIDGENLQRISDPCFYTRHGCCGMGLDTSCSIVARHGGHIVVESEQGKGARFSIYLPALSMENGSLEKEDAGTDLVGCRVLLMDDERVVRDVAGVMLKYLGYEVELAGDCLSAVEMYRRARESGWPFDVVITGLMVSDGNRAGEVIKELIDIN